MGLRWVRVGNFARVFFRDCRYQHDMSATPTQTSAPPSQRPRKTKNLEIKTYLNGKLVSDIVIAPSPCALGLQFECSFSGSCAAIVMCEGVGRAPRTPIANPSPKNGTLRMFRWSNIYLTRLAIGYPWLTCSGLVDNIQAKHPKLFERILRGRTHNI